MGVLSLPVSIVVATFGDRAVWDPLARRAVESALGQVTDARIVRVHDELSLARARNRGLGLVSTEWVVFLDADDELEAGYVQAMLEASADLRAPSVRYVRGGRPRPLWMPRVAGHDHVCEASCLRDGNWLVVGTMVRARLLRDVGGWHEWPCYEDWDLWLRCWLAGATVEAVPHAVYRAHVRSDSRNRAPSIEQRNDVHRRIVASRIAAP